MYIVVENYQKSNFNEGKSALGVKYMDYERKIPFKLFFSALIPVCILINLKQFPM